MDGDGCIDHNDLCGTLVSLGERVDEQAVRNMLAEVSYSKLIILFIVHSSTFQHFFLV